MAAVDKIKEKRKPEDFIGNRNGSKATWQSAPPVAKGDAVLCTARITDYHTSNIGHWFAMTFF